MLQTNYSRYKYTPDEMPEDDFLKRFVVREKVFQEIYKDIKDSNYDVPNQHYIIVGQRGQGKTTLLRKIQIEIKNDKNLSKFLIPIKFAEEQYQIRSLSRLWEEVADYLQTIHEDLFPTILDDMEEYFDDEDYELKAFSYFEKEIKNKDKKLLILVDNIDELIGKFSNKDQRRFREILLSSSTFRIIGGSTKMLEQHFDYGKPFYEFFKIVKLKGFNSEESKKFLLSYANSEEKKKIKEVIESNPERLETIRQLTGGVPRTLVMLFEIFLDEEGDAFEDLLKILDEVTPLYKHRMDDLPEQLQEIVHTIAINWDGMYTKEIVKKTRMESKAVSAQLKKLEKYEIIESESVGKNKIYKIKERFFNIWYLMRFGRKKDRQRVEWLIAFLNSWCSKEELELKANGLINNIKEKDLNPNYVYFMTEALRFCNLNINIDLDLKESSKSYLKKIGSVYFNEISSSDNEILMNAMEFGDIGEYEKAIDILEKSRRSSSLILWSIIDFNIKIKNFDRAELVIKKLLNKLEVNSLNKGYLYSIFLIKNNEFSRSWEEIKKILPLYEHGGLMLMNDFLIELISKKQYYMAREILELKEYSFKELLKPIWFALMKLMEDEYPNEYKKMGSELEESVNSILAEIEKLRKE